MHCEYAVWKEHQHTPEQSTRLGVDRCRCFYKKPELRLSCKQLEPCGSLGSPYQVSGQTGDHFKFNASGQSAPICAVLCEQHARTLVAQGFEVMAAVSEVAAE